MRARLALAAALALWPALASAQFAVIAPDTPIGDSSDRIANTRALQSGLANNPLASGKIFIGSAGGIATGQTMSGDATLSILGALTLATVNANVGTFGSATQCPTLTVNGKGLITAASAATCTPAIGSITGLATGVATALGLALNGSGGVIGPTPTRAGDIPYWNGSAWTTLAGNNSGTNCIQENASGVPSFASCGGGITIGTTTITSGTTTKVLFDNAGVVGEYTISGSGNVAMTTNPVFTTPNLGTPSALVATNATGTASGLTAGNVTTNANLTGPVTSVGNATTVTANSITNAMRAQMAAHTVKGNNSGSTANEADLTIPQLAAQFTAPTTSSCLTSGTGCTNGGFGGAGTYTTPANATWIEVWVVGGGGGAYGSGTTPGAPTDGGNSTFGTLTANGGAKGRIDGGIPSGGTCSGGDDNVAGGDGGQGGATTLNMVGGQGGSNPRGGEGHSSPGAVGIAAKANTGGGGGGAGDGGTAATGGGGAAGCWLRKIFAPPSATYAYTCGAGGTAGTAGTGGFAGGAGGSCFIQVIEHYN